MGITDEATLLIFAGDDTVRAKPADVRFVTVLVVFKRSNNRSGLDSGSGLDLNSCLILFLLVLVLLNVIVFFIF